MAQFTIYLNFENQTEEAFSFYKKVFRTEFEEEIQRFADMPADENTPPLTNDEKNLVMHVGLPIFKGYMLRGSDVPKSMGETIKKGNNMYIHLEVETFQEADRLFNDLKEGGKIEMELEPQFWGDYFGSVTDQFGIKWMVSCPK